MLKALKILRFFKFIFQPGNGVNFGPGPSQLMVVLVPPVVTSHSHQSYSHAYEQ